MPEIVPCLGCGVKDVAVSSGLIIQVPQVHTVGIAAAAAKEVMGTRSTSKNYPTRRSL